MDISVSHLNQRLAVQLPARLPLGLVFVVGQVENVEVVSGRRLEALRSNGRSSRVQFDLVDNHFRVRCALSARAAAEVDLEDGDEVRASGHLVFDPNQADYFLLARDIDLVVEDGGLQPAAVEEATSRIGRTALTPVLADIKKRSEAAQQAASDLPYWVQRMAPPEFQTPEQEEASEDETAVLLNGAGHHFESLDLNDGLVDFLSQAMDSEETIELTPSLLAQYPETSLEKIKKRMQPKLGQENGTVSSANEAGPTEAIQQQQRQIDRLVIAFIILIVLLTIVTLIGAVLLL